MIRTGSTEGRGGRATDHPTDPGYLRDLFSRNAATYDEVNAVISGGQVRRWRRELVRAAPIPADGRVLDAFAGPGSLSALALARLGPCGILTVADLSPAMLERARGRLAPGMAAAHAPTVHFLSADLLTDDPGQDPFDVVLLGFGLRYVPDPLRALRRLERLLRPGGHLAVLEFTRPAAPVLWALPAVLYFRHALPTLAARLAGDAELYAYLRDSAAGFLSPAALGSVLWQAGLTPVRSRVHLGGLVTLVVARSASEAVPVLPSGG